MGRLYDLEQRVDANQAQLNGLSLDVSAYKGVYRQWILNRDSVICKLLSRAGESDKEIAEQSCRIAALEAQVKALAAPAAEPEPSPRQAAIDAALTIIANKNSQDRVAAIKVVLDATRDDG